VQRGPPQFGALDGLHRPERDRPVEDVAADDRVEITGRVSEINDFKHDTKARDCRRGRRRRRASSEFGANLHREFRLGAEILAAPTPLTSAFHQRARGQASNDRLIPDE
jgi:hypothetical protein